jgi:hypothetical protein
MTKREALEEITEITQLLNNLGETGIAKKISDAVQVLAAESKGGWRWGSSQGENALNDI